MEQRQMPAGPTAALIQLLEESLREKAADCMRVQAHIVIETGARGELLSTGGEGVTCLEPKPHPIALKTPLIKAIKQFVDGCANAGVRIVMLDGEFVKADDWRHRLFAETAEEHRAFRDELKPLETRLVRQALERAGKTWTTVSVSRSHQPRQPDKLVIHGGAAPDIKEAPPEIKETLEAFQAEFVRHNRRLLVADLTIEWDPDDHDVDFQYFYRLTKGAL